MASLISSSLLQRRLLSTSKFARGFASPASSNPIKVPLILYGIDGRYATALYTAALKKNHLNDVEKELHHIKDLIEKDQNINNFLGDPSLSKNKKEQGIQKVLSHQKYSDVTINFFKVLAENNRLNETSKIIEAFNLIMTAHRGEVPVNIITAKEIESKILNQLKTQLAKSKFVNPNQKLIVKNKVNPSILGGLIIEFGDDKTIDLSVASKFSKLNKILTGIGGALRIRGVFLSRYYPYAKKIYSPKPTWGNHNAVFKDYSLEIDSYRYYDKTNGFNFNGLLGVDPTQQQW
ncbi:2370_t:CDS:2 [Entrophospora sp. SA101]|nr:2370_t:CDS:2 [Entrophospora sp. SA101]